MPRIRLPLRLPHLLATALLALALPGAGAQRFSVLPVVLDVNPERSLTTQTTFTNLDRLPMSFSVEVFEWTSEGGQDVLTPTSDVLVNPASFTLAPNGKQVIRVGVRRKPGDRELTYRVFIRQAPPAQTAAAEGSGTNVTVLLNLSLPVYIAFPSAAPKVGYGVRRSGNDLSLLVTNDGTRHLTYRDLIVRAGERTVRVESKAVLAGGTFELPLPGWGDWAGELSVTYRDASDQEVAARVAVPPR
ncbi:fimbrial biogenesis chaperone [Deinococcus aestuarii]|uniref:fimbrial biogenesis chaperone n=1 Tax=Deinococcus aestuarii TaxID=2774531 RepID=UPI001C0D56FB|nr:fimbria/pilus periplasmic chaperone [Deinococcus aestuarii]